MASPKKSCKFFRFTDKTDSRLFFYWHCWGHSTYTTHKKDPNDQQATDGGVWRIPKKRGLRKTKNATIACAGGDSDNQRATTFSKIAFCIFGDFKKFVVGPRKREGRRQQETDRSGGGVTDRPFWSASLDALLVGRVAPKTVEKT
jgi:hypothetical protein